MGPMLKRLTGTFLIAAVLGLCFQQPPGQRPIHTDKQNLLIYYDATGRRHRVKSIAEWETRRAQILRSMQSVMGPLPTPSKLPLDVTIESTEQLATLRRENYLSRF